MRSDENWSFVSEFGNSHLLCLRNGMKIGGFQNMILNHLHIYPFPECFVPKTPFFEYTVKGQNIRNVMFPGGTGCDESRVMPGFVNVNKIESTASQSIPECLSQPFRISIPESCEKS